MDIVMDRCVVELKVPDTLTYEDREVLEQKDPYGLYNPKFELQSMSRPFSTLTKRLGILIRWASILKFNSPVNPSTKSQYLSILAQFDRALQHFLRTLKSLRLCGLGNTVFSAEELIIVMDQALQCLEMPSWKHRPPGDARFHARLVRLAKVSRRAKSVSQSRGVPFKNFAKQLEIAREDPGQQRT